MVDIPPAEGQNTASVSPKKQALRQIQELKRALAALEKTVNKIQEAPKSKITAKAKRAGA